MVALPDIAMSPPSCALSASICSAAVVPRTISVFCHSAVSRLLETTYLFIPFMTSPNGSSACSGQYAAHSS